MKKSKSTLIILALLFSFSAATAQTMEQFQVLVYSDADRWHDPTLPNAIDELQAMADRHTFGMTWTQQPRNFNDEYLEKFDVIVFLHSKAYRLDSLQMNAFKKFIRSGKGFVGIHGTSAAGRQEEWFQKLVGRIFKGHPEEQAAVLNVVDKNHPSTMHLNDHWIWTDEWYFYGDALTDNLHELLTLDESTYETDRTWGDDRNFAMGEFHPIAWYQEYDGGRSFYTTLGHLPASYKDQSFMSHIFGGIYWAATGLGVLNK